VARRDHRAERLLEVAHRKDRVRAHDAAPGLRAKRVTSEPSPSGRNRIVNSSTVPRVICHAPGKISTAIERTISNSSEPTKAAATEPAPARMVTNTKPPDVVQ